MIDDICKLCFSPQELFETRYKRECRRVNFYMTWLMIGQWFAGIGFALFYSPLTWIGASYAIHVHVWLSVLLGGSITGFAILWARLHPDSSSTRHVMAVCQILWSALLIHLSGGRIESHFHVFVSLGILSIYRDWKILITATVVVAGDHFIRGVFFPLSAFGVLAESPFRWIEHAAWVLFEVSFLAPGCIMLRNDIYELCVHQVELQEAKHSVEEKVEQATSDLLIANQTLASNAQELEKLALVARCTDNAVVVTDALGQIEWVNEGYERITGYPLKEVQGSSALDLLNGPETDPNQLLAIKKAIERRQGCDCEMLRYRKDGTSFWMAIEARPIIDETGNLTQFILVESDISSRIHAEIEKQKLADQLIEASRAAGLADAATGVLHDIGNALNSANVSASMIQRQIETTALDKLKRVSDLIEQKLETFVDFVSNDKCGKKLPDYLVKLTNVLESEQTYLSDEFEELLDKIERIKKIVAVQQNVVNLSGVKQSIDIAELIDQAIGSQRGTLAPQNMRINNLANRNLPEVVSDKHKILRILVNLIKNAEDALNEACISNPKIEIATTLSEGSIQISVADNGIGVPAENLSKIFQHGFTTKEKSHGFGLHNSANAATELKGSLTATSEGTGRGATFVLSLPRQDSDDTGSVARCEEEFARMSPSLSNTHTSSVAS